MPDIVPPESFDDAVQPFPDGQRPYGGNCKIRLRIQAVLFHYGVTPEVVAKLEGEGFEKIGDFRLADPRGDAEQLALFETSVARHVKGALHLARLAKAFARMMRPHPFDAVVVAPPTKKVKIAASAVAPTVTDPVASTSSATGAAVASTSKVRLVSDSSSDGSDSASDDNVVGEEAADDASIDSTSAVKKATVAQLFEKVNTEVLVNFEV